MRFLVTLLFTFNCSFSFGKSGGHAVVFYKPLQASVIAAADYEDIRIDSNHDGVVDLWILQKGDTKIQIDFNQGVQRFSISKLVNGSFQEVSYQIATKSYQATLLQVRKPLVMNGTAEDACKSKTEQVVAELKTFTESLSRPELFDAADKAVSCSDNPEFKEQNNLLEKLIAKSINSRAFSNCLENSETIEALGTENKAALLYYSAKMQLDLRKIATKAAGSEGLITCQASDEKTLKAKYTENGKISFSIPKEISETDFRAQSAALLHHELLHRAGLKDEKTTAALIDICFAKDQENSRVQNNTSINALPLIVANVDESTKNAAKKEKSTIAKETSKAAPVKSRMPSNAKADPTEAAAPVNMAKEISVAEVQQTVPSAEKLALNSINMTDEGKAQAVAASQRQSAPVFAMADRAMGVMNTPALASADNSNSGERYQSRHGRYESQASKNVYVPSRTNGMKVVEEVDLTRQASRSSERTANAASSGNARMVASVGRGVTATNEGSPTASTDPEVNATNPTSAGSGSATALGSRSGGDRGSSSGGSGTYYMAGTQRKTNADTRRGVASGSSMPATEASREEIFSDFSGTSYSEMKSKLRSGEYRDKLVQNQVKIIDTYGGRIGAEEARTIYLDDGTRFIMQKRK